MNNNTEKLFHVELTYDEALVLKGAIQEWITTVSSKRIWPWRKIGWVKSTIYSFDIYCSARDKLIEVIEEMKKS